MLLTYFPFIYGHNITTEINNAFSETRKSPYYTDILSKQYGEKKYPQNVGKNATNFSLMSIVLSIDSENNVTHVELLHKLKVIEEEKTE